MLNIICIVQGDAGDVGDKDGGLGGVCVCWGCRDKAFCFVSLAQPDQVCLTVALCAFCWDHSVLQSHLDSYILLPLTLFPYDELRSVSWRCWLGASGLTTAVHVAQSNSSLFPCYTMDGFLLLADTVSVQLSSTMLVPVSVWYFDLFINVSGLSAIVKIHHT